MRRLIRRAGALAGAGLAVATLGAAQSSQFSSRGLGLPTRPYSAHALGLGGGSAMFDTESALNPASIAGLRVLQAVGTSTSNWRDTDTPFGSGFGRDTRYGLIHATGPVHVSDVGVVRVNASVTLMSYLDRNYGLTSTDSITLRGERFAIRDSLTSTGGISDLRVAASWFLGDALILGLGGHLLPGASRVYSTRVVDSEDYAPVREVRDVSYLGFGVSGGVIVRVSDRMTLAGLARFDTPTRVERETTPVGEVDFPVTLGVGIRAAPHARFMMAGHLLHRGWSGADASIKGQGGLGARDSREIGAGVTWALNSTNVSRWPLRLGAHHSTLPFPLEAGGRGSEFGISAGTGARFGPTARGSVDVAVERIWRTEGAAWRERAFMVTIGLSIRQ